jgi:hypothetical protein
LSFFIAGNGKTWNEWAMTNWPLPRTNGDIFNKILFFSRAFIFRHYKTIFVPISSFYLSPIQFIFFARPEEQEWRLETIDHGETKNIVLFYGNSEQIGFSDRMTKKPT